MDESAVPMSSSKEHRGGNQRLDAYQMVMNATPIASDINKPRAVPAQTYQVNVIIAVLLVTFQVSKEETDVQ